MTAEQAIEIIENEKRCVNRANQNDECNRDCYNCELVKTDKEILTALDMAIHALEQTKWIPVSERIPSIEDVQKYSNKVLATLENGYVCSLGYRFEDNKWEDTLNPVIAWMPLPKSYGKEQK